MSWLFRSPFKRFAQFFSTPHVHYMSSHFYYTQLASPIVTVSNRFDRAVYSSCCNNSLLLVQCFRSIGSWGNSTVDCSFSRFQLYKAIRSTISLHNKYGTSFVITSRWSIIASILETHYLVKENLKYEMFELIWGHLREKRRKQDNCPNYHKLPKQHTRVVDRFSILMQIVTKRNSRGNMRSIPMTTTMRWTVWWPKPYVTTIDRWSCESALQRRTAALDITASFSWPSQRSAMR